MGKVWMLESLATPIKRKKEKKRKKGKKRKEKRQTDRKVREGKNTRSN